jgi:hypothetical protein
MGAVASGSLKKKGLSEAKAQEFLDATGKGKKLPDKVKQSTKRGK